LIFRFQEAAMVDRGGLPSIPHKHYFKIGEVAKLLGVMPAVLRYWENEFEWLAPVRSGSRHRVYERREVELVVLISALLHLHRYTIERARKILTRLKGDWASGLRQLSEGGSVHSGEPNAELASTESEMKNLREEVQRIERQLERREQDLKEAKSRLSSLTRELLAEKNRSLTLARLVDKNAREMLEAAEYDGAPSAPTVTPA